MSAAARGGGRKPLQITLRKEGQQNRPPSWNEATARIAVWLQSQKREMVLLKAMEYVTSRVNLQSMAPPGPDERTRVDIIYATRELTPSLLTSAIGGWGVRRELLKLG